MSILPLATPAPTPRTKESSQISTLYASILLVFVLTQLFTFETFLELMVSYGFPGSVQLTYFATALLVACEVFALPFLLRMALSPAFRWVSIVCGWIVAIMWVKISFWVVFVDGLAENIGFLGTLVGLVPGWWAIFVSLSLGILAAWASWGMWPRQKVTRGKK